MIDRNADRPIYKQLADAIREQIADGTYAPGQDLPTAAAIGDRYDVGRDTVRDALAVLRAEGLVLTERGRPAYVAEHPADVVRLEPGDQVDVRGGTATVTRADGRVETYAGGVRIISADEQPD